MHRLRALDAQFLHLEDRCSPLHIAALCVFDGAAPSTSDFARLLTAKLHYFPRYRQRIRVPPLELGRPVWIDDSNFDLAYHLRRTRLPEPGDDTALCTLMGRVMSQALDRERPLWELWIVEGLENNRWAAISKIHHCMADGLSGLDLLALILDFEPSSSLPEPVSWKPEPEPSSVKMVRDAWAGLAQDASGWVRKLREYAQQPRQAARALRDTSEGALMFARRLLTVPDLSIEGPIGSHRVYAHSTAPLDELRAICRTFGGTLNDVVLAAIAGGFRTLLLERGEDVGKATLRTLVPVSVRKPEAKGTMGNRVSLLLCDLPLHLADPIERLKAVQADMQRLKKSHMAEFGELVMELCELAPPMVMGTVSRFVARAMHHLPQRTMNTITTNVPGPQFPLYCLGRPLLWIYPYVPITQGIRIGTAILSYNGFISFGINGDRDTASDIGVLARAIVSEIGELKRLAALSKTA